jgi:hypothetical protein
MFDALYWLVFLLFGVPVLLLLLGLGIVVGRRYGGGGWLVYAGVAVGSALALGGGAVALTLAYEIASGQHEWASLTFFAVCSLAGVAIVMVSLARRTRRTR